MDKILLLIRSSIPTRAYGFLLVLLLSVCGALGAHAQTTGATVYTDRADYLPGDVVIIEGAGWQPSEQVRLEIDHSTVSHGNTVLYATADGGGHIYNNEFVIQPIHFGESFTLAATGLSSGLVAQTAFTDGVTIYWGNLISNTGNTSSCAGSSFTFNSNQTQVGSNGTYVWTKGGVPITGATSASLTLNSLSSADAGVYKLIYSIKSGQTTTPYPSNEITLSVNNRPTASITSASTTICAGSGASIGGTVTATGAWTLTLNNSGGTVTGTGNGTFSKIVAPATTTTYSIQSLTDAGCSSTAADVTGSPTVTVAVPAISITGNLSLCAGGSSTLTANATTNIGTISAYQWNLNGSPINGNPAKQSTYAVTDAGTYTVTIAITFPNSTSCSKTSEGAVVTVNAPVSTPSISTTGPTTFCQGGSVTFTSSTPSGNQWYRDNALITGAINQTYVATLAGNYTVKVTDSNGCSSAVSAATSVRVDVPPTAATASSKTVTGTSTTLDGNVPTVGTGSWSITSGSGGSFDNTTSTTSTNPAAIFLGVGGSNYGLRWTISNGTCVPSYKDISIAFSQQATSLAVASASGTYSGQITLSATLKTGTAGLRDKTVNFSLNGGTAIAATTDANGVATVTGVSLNSIGAGTYTAGISASFAAEASYAASTGTNALTVGKATPVLTWTNPSTIGYGTLLSATELNATANVPGTLTYTPASGTKLSAGNGQTLSVSFAPSDAANYTSPVTKAATINVTPALLTITADNKTKNYDGQVYSAFTYTSSGFVNGETSSVIGGTISYTGAATTAINASPTAYTLTPVVTALTATNYSFAAATGTLIINKANQTITVGTPAPATAAYNTAFSVAATASSGLAVTYGSAAPLSNSGASYLMNSGTGTGTVTYNQAGDGNFNAAPSVTATVTATKATATLALGQSRFTYDGSAKPVAVTTTPAGLAVTSITYAGSSTAPANAGSYALVVTLSNSDYVGSTTGTLVIDPKPVTITADNRSKTYGQAVTFAGTEFSVPPGALVNGDAVTSVTLASAGAATGAGATTYSIAASAATGSGLSNYALSYAPGTLTVGKQTLTVTANDATRKYGAPNPAFGASYAGFANGETLANSGVSGAPALSTSATGSSPVGPYAISAAPGTLTATNYDFAFAPGTLAVTQATPVVTVTAAPNLEYNGSPKAATATAVGVGGASLPFTLQYEGLAPTAYPTGTTAPTAVGTYRATATFAPTTNYEGATSSVDFTITRKAATVVVDAKSKTYGDTEPTLTGTLSGFVAADNVVAAYSRTNGQAAGGSYSISATLTPVAVLANYALTYTDAPFTITKKAITVTADAKSKVYGDNDPALTYQVTAGAVVSPDVFTGSLVRNPGVNAGAYAITQGTLALSNNYTLTYIPANLTITKADATVSITPYYGMYDGGAHALTGTATGISSENLSSVLLFGSSFTNVPGGTATWTFAGGTNYNDQTGTGTVTITKATPTVALNLASPYTYTGLAQSVSGTVTGVQNASLGAATVAYQAVGASGFSATVPVTVGTYAVKGAFGGNGNYNAAETLGSMTIGKAVATVTLGNLTPTYDGTAKAASATTDATGSSSFTFTYNGLSTAPTNAGTYAVVASLSNDNYEASDATADLVIAKAPLTIAATDRTKVYGAVLALGAATAPADFTVTGLVNGNTVTGMSLASNGELATALANSTGYDITPSAAMGTGLSNYTITYATTGKLKVTKAPLTVLADNKAKTYGQPNPALTGRLSGVQNGDAIVEAYSTLATAASNAGTYTIVADGTATSSVLANYTLTKTNGVLTINKADAVVAVTGYTGTYDGQAHGATATVSGADAGGAALGSTLNLGATFTNVPGGTATWTFTGGTNYNDQSGTAGIAISKAAQTLTWAAPATITYGTALSVAQLNASTSGDGTLMYSPAAGTMLNAGRYTLSVSAASTNNYHPATASVSLMVNQADATISLANLTQTYTNTDKAALATASPAAAGVQVAYSQSGSAVTPHDAGDYLVTATLTNSNYKLVNPTVASIATVTGTLTINKAAITVTINGFTGTYDGLSHGAAAYTATGATGLGLTPAVTLVYTGTPNGAAVNSYSSTDAPTAAGTYTVTATYPGSANFVPASATATITINRATPSLTWSNPADIKYGTPLSGTQLNATATGVQGTALTNAGSFAYTPAAGSLLNAAPNQTLAVVFSPADANNYTTASKSVAINVAPQFSTPYADTYYTGASFYWTTSTTSNTATLNLVATLKNNPNLGSGNNGDIRTARVSFAVRNSTGGYSPISSAQNLPVGLVNPTDPTTGTASATAQYTINGSAASVQIAVIVSGNYTANDITTDKVIEIAVPTPGGLIAGGGTLGVDGSSGYIKPVSVSDYTLAATSTASPTVDVPKDIPAQFAFGVQYSKSLKNPQGNVEITVKSYRDRTGALDVRNGVLYLHTYRLKSNAISVLAITSATSSAQFSGKANIAEIVNGAEQSIEGNCSMQLDMTQNPNSALSVLAVTIYRNSGGVWYSSNWDGTKTVVKNIASGYLTVTSSGGPTPATTTTTATSAPSATQSASVAPVATTATTTLLELYPTPMAAQATVHFHTDRGGKAQVYLYNQLGALVTTLYNAEVQSGQEYFVTLNRNDMAEGVYYCRLICNGKVENHRFTIVR